MSHEDILTLRGTTAELSVMRSGVLVPQALYDISTLTKAIAERGSFQGPITVGVGPVGMQLRGFHIANDIFVFLVEINPGIRTLQWIRADSPAPYGVKATYRHVPLSLPYLELFVAIRSDGYICRNNSIYFSNTPITNTQRLREPHFLNCSVQAYGVNCWICNQYFELQPKKSHTFLDTVNFFASQFLGQKFNFSSEHHEGNSFFSKNAKSIHDPRVKTVEAWHTASVADPLFALHVPWIESSYTAQDVFNELSQQKKASHLAHVKDLIPFLVTPREGT